MQKKDTFCLHCSPNLIQTPRFFLEMVEGEVAGDHFEGFIWIRQRRSVAERQMSVWALATGDSKHFEGQITSIPCYSGMSVPLMLNMQVISCTTSKVEDIERTIRRLEDLPDYRLVWDEFSSSVQIISVGDLRVVSHPHNGFYLP